MTDVLTPSILRSMIAQVNACPHPYVSIPKPMARLLMSELLRLLESQDLKTCELVVLTQKLTIEYTCAHICDLLIGLMETNMTDVKLPDLLMHAIDQIEDLANDVKVAPVKNS